MLIRLRELLYAFVRRYKKLIVFGGRHQLYQNPLNTFFQRFIDNDVDLVFFDGKNNKPTTAADTKKVKRYNQLYDKSARIFGDIDGKIEIKMGYIRCQMGLDLFEIAKKYGEYRWDSEQLNKEMVRFAHENNNVIAIMGTDSDFLLLNMCGIQYWNCSNEYFDSKRYGITSIDQQEMINHLQLTSYQYLLMISVLFMLECDGGDARTCLKKNKSTKLSQQMESNYLKKYVDHISTLLRENWPHEQGTTDFIGLSILIFGCEKYAMQLNEAFDRYNIGANEVEENLKLDEESAICKALSKHKQTFAMWSNGLLVMYSHLVDLRPWNSGMLYSKLFLNVHKRAMGVMLNRQRYETVTRRILYKESHDTPFQIIETAVEFPPRKFQYLHGSY